MTRSRFKVWPSRAAARPYLAFLLALMFCGRAHGQTVLGKNPLDKFMQNFWMNTVPVSYPTNTNANAIIYGLNTTGTASFTNWALFTNLNLFLPGNNITFTTNGNGQVTISSTGGSGGGATNAITSLNGLTNLTQTFAVVNSGVSGFSIVSATGTHTFNMPGALLDGSFNYLTNSGSTAAANLALLNAANPFSAASNIFSGMIYARLGSSNATSLGSSTTNGIDFQGGNQVGLDQNGTNRFRLTNGAAMFADSAGQQAFWIDANGAATFTNHNVTVWNGALNWNFGNASLNNDGSITFANGSWGGNAGTLNIDGSVTFGSGTGHLNANGTVGWANNAGILDSTGGVFSKNGSSNAVAIGGGTVGGSSNPTNGIDFQGGNQIGFDLNGTNRMRFTNGFVIIADAAGHGVVSIDANGNGSFTGASNVFTGNIWNSAFYFSGSQFNIFSSTGGAPVFSSDQNGDLILSKAGGVVNMNGASNAALGTIYGNGSPGYVGDVSGGTVGGTNISNLYYPMVENRSNYLVTANLPGAVQAGAFNYITNFAQTATTNMAYLNGTNVFTGVSNRFTTPVLLTNAMLSGVTIVSNDVKVAAGTIKDSSAVMSADVINRILYDNNSAQVSLNWQSRKGFDANGVQSFDWSARVLYSGSTNMISWSNSVVSINAPNGSFYAQFTNSILLLNTNVALSWGTDLGAGLGPQIFYAWNHSSDPELIISSGNSVGIGVGIGNQGKSVFQLTTASGTHELPYLTADGTPGQADPTGEGWPNLFIPSHQLTFQSAYYSNSTAFFNMSLWRSDTIDTNGTTELRAYNPSTQTLRATNSSNPGIEQFAIMSWGVRVDGALTSPLNAPHNISTSFNIQWTNRWDLIVPGTGNFTVTDTTTNQLSIAQCVNTKDVIFQSGIDVKGFASWPSLWVWLSGSPPAAISSNTIMKVHLDLFGSSDTNVLATWSTNTYTAPALDTDVAKFFTAATVTNALEHTAVIQLVSDLKAHGLWTKLFALYPFVTTSPLGQSMNLINTNTFKIAFHGTTNAASFSTNGFTGDGSTVYGDTGIQDSTAPWSSSSALLFTWVRAPQAPTDNGAFFGVNFNGSTFTHLGRSGTGLRSDGPFHTDGAAVGLLISGDWRGFAGLNRFGSGSNGEQTYVNSGPSGGSNGAFAAFAGTDVQLLDDTTGFSNANLASAGFGTGFSAADVAQLIIDLGNFNAVLGR